MVGKKAMLEITVVLSPTLIFFSLSINTLIYLSFFDTDQKMLIIAMYTLMLKLFLLERRNLVVEFLFIQQAFIDHLPCARHYLKY